MTTKKKAAARQTDAAEDPVEDAPDPVDVLDTAPPVRDSARRYPQPWRRSS